MKTILTVDDSPSIRQMLAYVLTSNGYKVIEAERRRSSNGCGAGAR